MINVLKSVLQNGMEIEKVKEMANEYRVTLKYKGMTGNCSVSKMCTPGNEKSLCMKSIDTAISGMYINVGNLAEAKAWLDGERWNIEETEFVSASEETKEVLENILERIEQADDFEINEIIQAVIRRYKLVFPDWEIIFLSLPVQSEERKLLLDQTIDQLKKL